MFPDIVVTTRHAATPTMSIHSSRSLVNEIVSVTSSFFRDLNSLCKFKVRFKGYVVEVSKAAFYFVEVRSESKHIKHGSQFRCFSEATTKTFKGFLDLSLLLGRRKEQSKMVNERQIIDDHLQCHGTSHPLLIRL